MPQISLYLNNATMDILRQDAKLSDKSLSSYVAELITSGSSINGWPDGYWKSVYGALCDDSFQIPQELDMDSDGSLPQF